MENNSPVGLKSLTLKHDKINGNLNELIKIVNELKEDYQNKIKQLDIKLNDLDTNLKKVDQLLNIVVNN